MPNTLPILHRLLKGIPSSLYLGPTFWEAERAQKALDAAADPVRFVTDYQQKKLRHVVALASKAAYYRALPQISADKWAQIPAVNKRIMQTNPSAFLVSKHPRFTASYVTTGGTSGKPFGFWIDRSRMGAEWFAMTRQWARVGFDRNRSWRAVLRNHLIPEGKSYQTFALLGEWRFSNFNLDARKLGTIVTELERLQPSFVHAYPSTAYALARVAHARGTTLPYLKAFLCGSESALPHQREFIEKRLGIRMFTWYGHSEKLILAGECEGSHHYHANPLYGYAELLDEHGKRIETPGQRGELVGTGFMNSVMPFLRYRTEDTAEYVGERCETCGRVGLIFKNVTGRWQGDRVYSRTGTWVTTTALNMHSDLYDNVANMQFYQDRMGILVIRIVRDKDYQVRDETRIVDALARKAGEGFEIRVDYVADVEYSAIGKYKLLIQKLKVEDLGLTDEASNPNA